MRDFLASEAPRRLRWLLLALLVGSYPLALVLPVSAGWENGWIEQLQLVVLLAGFGHALWLWRSGGPAGGSRDIATLRLAAVAVPVWLLCAARETSWGATLFTPGVPTDEGRYYTSSILWYHPAIAPLVIAVVAGVVVAFVRWRLDQLLWRLVRDRRFPWFELALMGLGAVLSNLAEGRLRITLPGSEPMRVVMEEGTELLCYAALVLAQARLFAGMAEAKRP